MGNLDWGMIGAIATIFGIVVTIIISVLQSKSSEKNQESRKQNNQVVKGLFVSNNNIEQKNK